MAKKDVGEFNEKTVGRMGTNKVSIVIKRKPLRAGRTSILIMFTFVRHLPHGRLSNSANFRTHCIHLILHVYIDACLCFSVCVIQRTNHHTKTSVREINFQLIKCSKSIKKRSGSKCRKTMKHIRFGFLHHLNGYRRENNCFHIEKQQRVCSADGC